LRPTPPTPSLFPYTTLFRSGRQRLAVLPVRLRMQLDHRRGGVRVADALAQHRLDAAAERVEAEEGLVDEHVLACGGGECVRPVRDRKSTRLNSSHVAISYAV